MNGSCTVSGCGKPAKAKGLCTMHYQRYLRKGDPVAASNAPYRCKVSGCMLATFSRGFCKNHFAENQLYVSRTSS